MTVLCFVSVL